MKSLSFAALLLLAGCGAMPRHAETRVARASAIEFVGGPVGADVLLGDQRIGGIAAGRTTVPVPDGTHRLRVMRGGAAIYDRLIFMQDGSRKVIALPAG